MVRGTSNYEKRLVGCRQRSDAPTRIVVSAIVRGAAAPRVLGNVLLVMRSPTEPGGLWAIALVMGVDRGTRYCPMAGTSDGTDR